MSTFDNNLKLEEIGTGEQSGQWGNTTNANLELIGEALGYGTKVGFSSDADNTNFALANAPNSDAASAMYLKLTSGYWRRIEEAETARQAQIESMQKAT